MTESPRWERESQEDLSAPVPQPSASERGESTIEFDMRAAGLQELADPPEFGPDDDLPAERLGGARESLAATRQSARESLAAGRERTRDSLAATRESARESLSAGRERTRESLGATRESLSSAAGSVSDTAVRVGRWLAALDRRPEFDAGDRHDPVAELRAGPLPEEHGDDESRFPIARHGYDRAAVDRHLAALESELAQLRSGAREPLSINEEIERLGEQAASILVTAHDSAHETARRAQEQAARAVTEAAGDAERITAEAQQRLRELDEETDAVWRERERLLDDVREVSATLATLADAASERFPAAEPVAVGAVGAAAVDDDGED